MTYNCENHEDIETSDGPLLKVIDELIHLGSLVNSSDDIAKTIWLAWTARNKMKRIWKSTL